MYNDKDSARTPPCLFAEVMAGRQQNILFLTHTFRTHQEPINLKDLEFGFWMISLLILIIIGTVIFQPLLAKNVHTMSLYMVRQQIFPSLKYL